MIINSFSVFLTLFLIGMLGMFLNQRNILIMLMSLEMLFFLSALS